VSTPAITRAALQQALAELFAPWVQALDLRVEAAGAEGVRLRLPLAELQARYELCEDMAQMLLDTANTKKWELGVETQDIVARIEQGLQGGEAGLSEAEAQWIALRLAELMD